MVMVKSIVSKAGLSLKGSCNVMVLLKNKFFLQLHICCQSVSYLLSQ